MQNKSLFLSLALFLISSVVIAQVVEYRNANWFIDGQFTRKTLIAVDGRFTDNLKQKPDTIVDLEGAFCIAPFADAHTHNLDGNRGLKEMTNTYLNQGVFYVQVLGNYGTGAIQSRMFFEKDSRLEARFANGLLTSTYGHGFYPYEPLAMGIYAPYLQIRYADSIKKSRIAENNAYYFFDSPQDVENKWSLVMKYKPDLIKIVLNDVANYPKKRALEIADDNGLSEEVAAYIVRKAHEAGLRVFAHVETANDGRVAAKIGVDGLAHLPGYFWNGRPESAEKYCLTKDDIALFKKKAMMIIPTFNIHGTTQYDTAGKPTFYPANFQRALAYKISTLRSMHKAGVHIALGADYFGKTVEPEIDSLVRNKVFSNAELLDIYSRKTSQAIFPGRKIGELKPGFEASFLVLDENPLIDISAIRKIRFRIKKAAFINPG